MRTRRPEPHTLAGAYALDALTRADRARFECHLARCQQCAAEISGLRETTARLAVAAAAEPPAGLIQRAVAAAARTRQLPPLTRGTPPPWPPRRRAAAAFAGTADGTPAGGPFRRIWLPRVALAFAGVMVILAAAFTVAYDDVVETAEANLDAERVRRCLRSLTILQREAVTLAYYGGYTYRQVAGLLGVAAGTVSTRMRDGLIRLRDCLGVQP